MKTALILFLTYFIKFDEDTSTVIYHSFTVLAYMVVFKKWLKMVKNG